MKYDLPETYTLDLNLPDTYTASVAAWTNCTFQVVPITGSWATAVVTFERSNDNTAWYDLESATTLSGEGMTADIDCAGFAFIRARVSTQEGSACTAALTMYKSDRNTNG